MIYSTVIMSLRLPLPYKKEITLQNQQAPDDLVFLELMNHQQIPKYVYALCMLHRIRLYEGRFCTPDNIIAICPAPDNYVKIWHLVRNIILGEDGLCSGQRLFRYGIYDSVIPPIGSVLDLRYNFPSSGFVMELTPQID